VCAYKSPVCCVYGLPCRGNKKKSRAALKIQSLSRRCARCEFDISFSACTIFLKLPPPLNIYLQSRKLPQHLFLFLPHSVRACGWVDEKKRRVRFFMRAILNDAPLSEETSASRKFRARQTHLSRWLALVCVRERINAAAQMLRLN
jgi:hypothetical protein